MTVNDADTVDFVAIDRDVRLIVADHLAWGESEKNDLEHLYKIQEKINAYMAWVEGGSLYEEFANAKGKQIIINIRCLHIVSEVGWLVFNKMKNFLRDQGYGFEIQQNEGSSNLTREEKL